MSAPFFCPRRSSFPCSFPDPPKAQSYPSHSRVIRESFASHLRVGLGKDPLICRMSVANDQEMDWSRMREKTSQVLKTCEV